MSALEEQFKFHCELAGLARPEREYRFGAIAAGGPGKGLRERLSKARLKDWRFDFAWPDQKVAVEIEGGTYAGGRHVRGTGFAADTEKYNAAVLLGWRVLRFDSKAVKSARAVDITSRALREGD